MNFRSAGDFGDLIYGLAIVKHMGGGAVLYEATRWTREPMMPARWAQIEPLVASQPYVTETRPFRGEKDCINLNDFRARAFPAKWKPPERSIMQWMLMTHGVPEEAAAAPWLTVPPRYHARILVNRSPRYQNPRFPWRAVLAKYQDRAFIGLQQEHNAFCKEFGPVPYLPTENLMEAALLIAGCDLFVGNQSACYAIAEGLKKNAVLEVYPTMPNCLFHRPGVTHGWNETVSLPDLC